MANVKPMDFIVSGAAALLGSTMLWRQDKEVVMIRLREHSLLRLGMPIAAACVIAACQFNLQPREAKVVSGSEELVSVQADDKVSAFAVAEKHCQQYGKSPATVTAFAHQERLDHTVDAGGGVEEDEAVALGNKIYHFSCT